MSQNATNEQIVNLKKQSIYGFTRGIKQGIPIALGYIPVSFTFGLMAVNGGLPVWTAVLISLTNFTSAGQFAGTSLIIASGSMLEITLTTFVINIRYMLMSLSLSQKIVSNMPMVKRCIMAFGITDETFTVASLEKEDITFGYMMGTITYPYLGWLFGTLLGAVSTSILPEKLQSSMGIALYAMFIALIIPTAKKSKQALIVVIAAVFISLICTWIPYLKKICGGWSIVISTIIASSIGAAFFPKEDDEI
ncbi:AzlC family ABC transporter permease [Clostridium polyendosporum]|uniref:AzlC family ABC transporter permease n=1 Tax=Clostridium polyendosporum TaxID=69208 RepID=UPI001BB450C5